MLYVYTCHEMYKSTDGYNHQANLRFTFNQKTGVPTDVLFDVSEEKNGYCSHSFNQFIDIQETDVYTLDHGDAYPRGIFLAKYANNAGERLNNPTTVQTVLPFPGDIGDRTTKTSLGGFAVSDTTCLIPYNQGGNSSQRSIYLGTIGKDEVGTGTLKSTTLDTPDADSTYGVPMLTRLSDGRYLIRWQVFSKDGDLVKKARYAIVDGTGSIVSSVKTIEAYLSDCQPHVSEDGIVSWYTTGTKSESDTVPTFYHLNTATDEFTSAKAFVLPTLKTPVLKSINKKTGVLKGTGTKGATIHILFADREFLVNCNKKKAYTLKLRKFYKKKLKKGATIKIYATMDGYNDSKTKTYKVP